MIARICLCLSLIVSFAAFAGGTFHSSTLEIKTAEAAHFFTVEIAETQEQQAYGLMFRTSLEEDKGMLFLFKDRPDTRMWMKNTLIPLDMLFMDKAGTIFYIAHETTPESLVPIGPETPAAAVLEIAGGVSKKLGIKEGDVVKHSYFEN